MVPDDQVGVAVVDLGQVGSFVLVEMSSSPLYVAPASHQSGHSPLDGLGLAGRAGLAGDSPPHAALVGRDE